MKTECEKETLPQTKNENPPKPGGDSPLELRRAHNGANNLISNFRTQKCQRINPHCFRVPINTSFW